MGGSGRSWVGVGVGFGVFSEIVIWWLTVNNASNPQFQPQSLFLFPFFFLVYNLHTDRKETLLFFFSLKRLFFLSILLLFLLLTLSLAAAFLSFYLVIKWSLCITYFSFSLLLFLFFFRFCLARPRRPPPPIFFPFLRLTRLFYGSLICFAHSLSSSS